MKRFTLLLSLLAALALVAPIGLLTAGSSSSSTAAAAATKKKTKKEVVKPTSCKGKGKKQKCTRPGHICKKTKVNKKTVWKCTPRKKSTAPGGSTNPGGTTPGATTDPVDPGTTPAATSFDYSGTASVTRITDDSLIVEVLDGSLGIKDLAGTSRLSLELAIRDSVAYSVDGATDNVGTEDVCVGDNVSFAYGTHNKLTLGQLDDLVPTSVAVTAVNDCFAASSFKANSLPLVASNLFAVKSPLATASTTRLLCATGSSIKRKGLVRPKSCSTLGPKDSFADAVNLRNLVWKNWGSKTATATGTEMGFHGTNGVSVKVTVSVLFRNTCGGYSYTRIKSTSRYGTTTQNLPAKCSD